VEGERDVPLASGCWRYVAVLAKPQNAQTQKKERL